jgi:hypothetical protein
MSAYVVNGKEPVSVWCPSRDDTGNGTTTLSDLVGSKPGTLTNFALTGSTSNWVADTGAGGVRALAFDGANDYVEMGSAIITSTTFSLSAWAYPSANKRHFIIDQYEATSPPKGLVLEMGFIAWKPRGLSDGSSRFDCSGPSDLTLNTWAHLVFTTNGSRADLYVNGSLVSSDIIGSPLASTTDFNLGRYRHGNLFLWNGRMDDIRAFNAIALDSSDVTYLYNSGSGRGIQTTSSTQHRRSAQSSIRSTF